MKLRLGSHKQVKAWDALSMRPTLERYLNTMAVWAIIKNNESVLLLKRSSKTSRAGQWCFPGGGIKDGESPREACLREVKEETNLELTGISELLEVNGSYYFICECNSLLDLKLKLNEVVEYSWIPPENVLNLGPIMEFKKVYKVLIKMGIDVKLNDEARVLLS